MKRLLSEQIAKKSKDQTFQTFEGHTIDSLIIFKDYLVKNKDVLKNFSIVFEVDYDELLNLMFLSIFLHDIGKLTKEFQRKIIKGESCGYFAHAFFGLPFINSDLPENLNTVLRLLVVSHHTQLYNRIYEDANLSNKVNYLNNEITAWIDSYHAIYLELFSSLFLNKFKPYYIEKEYLSKIELNESIKESIRELKRKQNTKNIQTKAIYSLCLSILKHCDQKASKFFDGSELEQGVFGSIIANSNKLLDTINYNTNRIFADGKESILKSHDKDKQMELYEYQKILANVNDSAIISAPCGRGKTEGALLGAINIINTQNKNKIIFALPTQITSNAMYDRLKGVFGDHNVGLYHGMSRYHHYEADDINEDDLRSLVFGHNLEFQ